MIDYADLDSYLLSLGAGNEAAEAHAVVCGLICAGADLSEGEWVAAVLGSDDPEAVTGALDNSQLLAELKGFCAGALAEGETVFDLWLPDDEVPVEERVTQLGAWCQGYLYGLGIGGLQDLDTLDEASREVVDDLLAISQVATEGIDEAEAEEQLVQLQEYVRVGVLLIFETLNPLPQASAAAPTTLQ
ncbi:MAG: UPF0149 family protein [Pseudomonadota bacterium]